MRCFPTLMNAWRVYYPFLPSNDSYSPAHTSSHIPFDSSRPPESNKTLADCIRPLAMEVPHIWVSSPGGLATDLSLRTATGMSQLRAIHHSICDVHRNQMRGIPTRADAWLACYPSLFSTDSYSPSQASSYILFDSSRPPDSNKTLLDWLWLLAVE